MTKELAQKIGITTDKDLTDEEVVAEVQKIVKGKDDELANRKGLIDKHTAEISRLKKEAEAKMTDDEKAKAHLKELEDEVATYKKDKSVAERKASYLGLGYSDELASKIALAEIEGNPTAEFHKQHQEELVKKTLAEKIDKTNPPHTTETDKVTQETFDKMGYEERVKLYEKDPATYNKFAKKQ